MSTVNIDIINCQTGNVRYITFAQSSFVKVYERFSDEQVGLTGIKSSYLGRQVLGFYQKYATEIQIKKGPAFPSIKHTIVLKVEDLSLQKGVIDFDLRNQKSLEPEQIYIILSKVKTYGNLYYISEFKRSAIKLNKDALLE